MEVAPRRKAPRKRKAREPEDEVQIVPVGDHATLLGLPTEILDDIARCVTVRIELDLRFRLNYSANCLTYRLLILSHPRHALEFGLSSKLLHLLVRGSLGWKIIVDAAGLKVPKVTKAVTFPYLTAVSRGWPKLCWGCHMVKKGA